MYRIAIVEDMEQDAGRLIQCLEEYQKKQETDIHYEWIHSATEFLKDYRHQYDLIFMDIRMPGIDGMQAAHALREMDHTVVLIFLTSLAQYALHGYEVEALDYILKPITYPMLEMKLKRALKRCSETERAIVVSQGTERVCIGVSELKYIEIFDHHIQYRTTEGVVKAYGSLKAVEKQLPETGFFRMNNQTIVNLKYVTQVSGGEAMIGDKAFPISRMRKKEFMEALHRYGMNG